MFGFATRKLDLLPGNENDSHRQDCINYSVPKLSKRSSHSQCRNAMLIPRVA